MAMVEIAVEEGLEAIEILTSTTEILETTLAATDTFSLVGETIEEELGATLETTLNTTVTEQLSTVVTESVEETVIEAELDQAINDTLASQEETIGAIEEEAESEATTTSKEGISSSEGDGASDPDSTADEDGKTKDSMIKVIGKWTHRFFNFYMLLDMIGKMVMKFVDAAKGSNGSDNSSKYSTEDIATMTDLSNIIPKLSIIFQSLEQSIKAITESTNLLGNETVTENGKTASVKDIIENILSTISQQLNTCQEMVKHDPFTSSDITDLGDGVYQVITRMNALFQLKTKSEVLTDFDIPTEDNRETLNAILKFDFVKSKDSSNEKIQEIQAIKDDPEVQDQVKAAAVSAAKDVVYDSIVDATKKAVVDKYQPEAKAKASSAAKDAATKAADSYRLEMFSEAFVPVAGSTLLKQTQEKMKAAATTAGQKAAEDAIKDYFNSSSVKEGVTQIAKEQTTKIANEKKDEIKTAAGNAVETTLKTIIAFKTATTTIKPSLPNCHVQ